MSEETPGHEGQDWVAPDETTEVIGDVPVVAETAELSAEAQATLTKLDRVLEIWNENVKSKSMTPYGDRSQEYQRNNIPILENLKFDLRAGKTTFIDTSEKPRVKNRKISDKLEEIYQGLSKLR